MMTLFTDIDHDFDHDCEFNLSKAFEKLKIPDIIIYNCCSL